MEEEKYIEELVGKRNPFRVPEGYFDNLTAQIMESLPEQKPKAKSVWLRKPMYYAAACVCALLISATAWLLMSEPTSQTAVPMQAHAVQQEVTDEEFEEAADYMMLDNHEIYALLSEN